MNRKTKTEQKNVDALSLFFIRYCKCDQIKTLHKSKTACAIVRDYLKSSMREKKRPQLFVNRNTYVWLNICIACVCYVLSLFIHRVNTFRAILCYFQNSHIIWLCAIMHMLFSDIFCVPYNLLSCEKPNKMPCIKNELFALAW